MWYPALTSKKQIAVSVLTLIVTLTSASNAFALSNDVINAMDQANHCKKIAINHQYEKCMQENNQQLKSAIHSKMIQKAKQIAASKREKVIEAIRSRMKSNLKLCQNEQQKFGDSETGQRRQPYCIYENMLEILINVERNIKIYAR